MKSSLSASLFQIKMAERSYSIAINLINFYCDSLSDSRISIRRFHGTKARMASREMKNDSFKSKLSMTKNCKGDKKKKNRQKREREKMKSRRRRKACINIISLSHSKSSFSLKWCFYIARIAICNSNVRRSIYIKLCHFRPRENASSFTNLIFCLLVQI